MDMLPFPAVESGDSFQVAVRHDLPSWDCSWKSIMLYLIYNGSVVVRLIIGECNKQVKQLLQPARKKTNLHIEEFV